MAITRRTVMTKNLTFFSFFLYLRIQYMPDKKKNSSLRTQGLEKKKKKTTTKQETSMSTDSILQVTDTH